MKKAGFKERFTYWFDTRMSKGTISMIKMLTVATLVVVLLLALIISAGGFAEDGGFFSVFWNNLATVINAWMPYADEGSAGYVILTAIAAVAGLLLTSVLIGIISSGIEDRLTGLRKGNSRVLEQGHKVILGLISGEYELIRQLILAAGDEKAVLVIAEEMERDEMEDLIRDNVEIPKNVRIICRNVDICDPAALSHLSIPDSVSVVISPMEDSRAVKAVLAVKKVLEEEHNSTTVVSASVTQDNYLLPSGGVSLIMLQTYDILARILAHSGTQPGLSDAFMEVMSFEGSEFYLDTFPEAEGLSFREITDRTEGAAVIGMETGSGLVLAPDPEAVLNKGSKLLFFTDNKGNYRIVPKGDSNLSKTDNKTRSNRDNKKPDDPDNTELLNSKIHNKISAAQADKPEKVVIIGSNEVTDTVLRELPEMKTEVVFADVSDDEVKEITESASNRNDLTVSFYDGQVDDISALNDIMTDSGHVILLSNHDEDREGDDMTNMLRLLKLRQLREEKGLDFSIAAEMFSEKNRALVSASDPTDFIVANNLSSMVLAQMAEDPLLYPVFHEILCNEGKDLFLVSAGDILELGKQLSVRELKNTVLNMGLVLLGFVDNSPEGRSVSLNPSPDSILTPDERDYLIVIGDQK
ncbi:MAG: hypothetical protein J6Y89_11270 [Lachnospiraceae bacterium]|nr:hypothetical protein [Lachnospiraceae bacterium]